MAADRLVAMANQIGHFFAHRGPQAPALIAAHIRTYWDPRMRSSILAHLAQGGAGLDPSSRAAIEQLAGSEPPDKAASAPVSPSDRLNAATTDPHLTLQGHLGSPDVPGK